MKVQTYMSRLNETAPVLSLALVFVFTTWLRHSPTQIASVGPEQEVVAQAVETAPYRIGPWVGVDSRVPEAAVRLLKPNAMLSRSYNNLETHDTVNLVVVHSGDARDMLGHYPPVCYPNAGWIPRERDAPGGEKGETVTLNMHGLTFRAQMYEFSRLQGWTEEQRIRIFNFFVLPDGTLTHDINHVGKRTRWLGSSVHGVAQIQLITDSRLSDEQAKSSAKEVLEGMEHLMNSMGVFDHE